MAVYVTAITVVWLQSPWAFCESCTTDNSWSEHSSNGGLAREDTWTMQINGYAAIFLREMRGLSTSSSYNVTTIIHNKI